jgi:hypothetical protein
MQFRRFDWLAFLRHSETNQTNRLEVEPIRQRSQRPFPKSRDSTAVASAPISETDVHSPTSSNSVRSVERDFWGLSGIESRSFWLDTIPEAFASETGTRKSWR